MVRCSVTVWPWRHLAHPECAGRGLAAGPGHASRVCLLRVPTPPPCDQCHRDPVLHAATMAAATPPAPHTLTLVIQLCVAAAASAADQPWSPIVGGRALLPPLLSGPQLLLHSGLHTHPGLSLARADPPPAPGPSVHQERQYTRRLASPRAPHYRRNYRRRRRYWRDPRSRYRRVRSHSYFSSASSPAPSPAYRTHYRWAGSGQAEGRARAAREDSPETGRSFVRRVRNLFGAAEHCLEAGRQYSCTFAPVCWMTGGVATPGTAQQQPWS